MIGKENINTSLIQTAALLGALGVVLGAFGAHGLRSRVPAEAIAVFEVGVRYLMYHVFAIALTGLLYGVGNKKRLKWAGNLFTAGIILFSGSLFALTFAMGSANPALLKLGIITPIGGVCFIAGWLLLAFSFGKES